MYYRVNRCCHPGSGLSRGLAHDSHHVDVLFDREFQVKKHALFIYQVVLVGARKSELGATICLLTALSLTMVHTYLTVMCQPGRGRFRERSLVSLCRNCGKFSVAPATSRLKALQGSFQYAEITTFQPYQLHPCSFSRSNGVVSCCWQPVRITCFELMVLMDAV